jgi:two-component system, OmpR family, sensor histidine kinase ChvG
MTRLASWRPSKIGSRLLAFNLLVVFVPVIGVLYLDVYEARLLQAQEREMVQQARVLSAVLGDEPQLDVALIERAFARLERRTEARLQVFDAHGTLVADSRNVPMPTVPAGEYPSASRSPAPPAVRERALYKLGAWMANLRERLGTMVRSWSKGDETPEVESEQSNPAVRQALDGRYGAATRRTRGQRSLTLVSALPVRHQEAITGAVVVSQSTFRVLQALYYVRLRIFEVVLISIVAAAALTTLAAMTIVRPLKRLHGQASALAERRQPLRAAFPGIERRDEIGDLARAWQELTRRLDDHISRLESFAADMAHEFKNPLASIRAAADTIADAGCEEDRLRFLAMMRRDVQRLDRLVAGVREMARIDHQLEHEALASVDLQELLKAAVESVGLTSASRARIVMRSADRPCHVRGTPERLAQAFENILSNALSFAPEGSVVNVSTTATGSACRVAIADAGPGIPDAHLGKVFDRFFSYRPEGGRGDHLGLGLAIARQIVESYGGRITAANGKEGGALFEVELERSLLK